MGGGQSIRNAPPIISESMTFPYLRGMVFCAKLANKGGWAAIDEVYRDPPLSTEQILHPEKYREQPDYPMSIDLGTLAPGEGWKEVGRNVLGEMQLAILLKKHGGKDAAAGWDGDRYAVFEGPKGKARAWSGFPPGIAPTTPVSSCAGMPPVKAIRSRIWAGSRAPARLDLAKRRRRALCHRATRLRRDRRRRLRSRRRTVALVTSALQAKKTELKPAPRKEDKAGTKPERVSALVR